MANTDTAELLKECEQGVKMGIEAISDVLPRTDDERLKKILNEYSDRHKTLVKELGAIMKECGIAESEPSPMVKGMADMKVSFKMMLENKDKTVADLMTDGCDMGIKSLNKYLNQYESADRCAKDIAEKIIKTEEEFEERLKRYL